MSTALISLAALAALRLWDVSALDLAVAADHCFPAGHACTAFAWVGGYFALGPVQPTAGRRWLSGAGAHFTSHALWTAWLCWTWAWACSAFPPGDRRAAAAG